MRTVEVDIEICTEREQWEAPGKVERAMDKMWREDVPARIAIGGSAFYAKLIAFEKPLGEFDSAKRLRSRYRLKVTG